jgi:hypothetical protein
MGQSVELRVWEDVVDSPIQSSAEKRLPVALLAYAVALAICLLVPPFLKAPVVPPEGFTLQEAADLLTPLVAIPLAWVVVDLAGGLGRRGLVAFLVVSAIWVEGQGIHLAANAIGDAFPKGGAEVFYATVPGNLDYWLDEILSHWMWHVGWVAISGLMLMSAVRSRVGAPDRTSLLAASAGLVYGATFFCVNGRGSHDLARDPGLDPAARMERLGRPTRTCSPSGRHVPRGEHRRYAAGLPGLGLAERLDATRVQQGGALLLAIAGRSSNVLQALHW